MWGLLDVNPRGPKRQMEPETYTRAAIHGVVITAEANVIGRLVHNVCSAFSHGFTAPPHSTQTLALVTRAT